MNSDQWTSLIRSAAIFLGGILATKGFVSSSDAAVLVTAIITLGSALVTVIPAVWGIMTHSHASMAASLKTTVDGQNAMIGAINHAANGVSVVTTVNAKSASIPVATAVIKLGPGQ